MEAINYKAKFFDKSIISGVVRRCSSIMTGSVIASHSAVAEGEAIRVGRKALPASQNQPNANRTNSRFCSVYVDGLNERKWDQSRRWGWQIRIKVYTRVVRYRRGHATIDYLNKLITQTAIPMMNEAPMIVPALVRINSPILTTNWPKFVSSDFFTMSPPIIGEWG